MTIEKTELLEYACRKFQDEQYDEALEAFVLAYQKGYERDWVIENIYACYMSGNEDTFQNTYKEHEKIQTLGVKYEDCALDFVPYREGQYYIFDKETNCFRGIFSIADIENVEEDKALQESEFSSVAVELEWNWNNIKQILTAAKERKIYVVCEDLKRAVSYFKIPELIEYMVNVMVFASWEEYQKYFHKHTSVYLPRIFCGSKEYGDIFYEIMEEEHTYRLTTEGRNANNVVLTIGIPTHARGNLLLKRLENLCKLQLDSEIEFAISKNGTQLYQDEYKRASQIQDSRINYYDHECELSPEQNWSYVMEMAHGKYVLLVSDEDDIVPESLEHYLKLLDSNPEVNLVRASGSASYTDIKELKYKRKGIDAFDAVFLRQNYLSGLIIRRKDFLKENFGQLTQFQDNEYYHRYPHDWWCTMLSTKGDYIEDPICLIIENESVLEKETDKYQELGLLKEGDGFVEDLSLPRYATYKERLKQFQGQIEFLHWFLDKNDEAVPVGLINVIGKATILLKLAREQHYDSGSFTDIVDQFIWLCMNAIDEFQINELQKANLLLYVQNCAVELMKLHEKMITEEKGK